MLATVLMITLGSWEEAHWNDDWTVVTKDLRRTAQFEHTMLVTEPMRESSGRSHRYDCWLFTLAEKDKGNREH